MPDMSIRLARYGVLTAMVLPVCAAAAETPETPDRAVTTALASPQRSAKFMARDASRHPAKALAFLGLRPDMSVVEIWPGGGYWTEILAPILKDRGHYTIALPPAGDPSVALAATPIGRKVTADRAAYGMPMLTLAGRGHDMIAPPGSVDLVVSFRNLHNWMAGGYAPEMFASFFKALKHGGTLGIEEHRGHRSGAQDPKAADGYVAQATVIGLARDAGFTLEASSEMNANPKDTANWPHGVWTLPPDLALGDKDKAKYLAIGEADNSVLKFRKP